MPKVGWGEHPKEEQVQRGPPSPLKHRIGMALTLCQQVLETQRVWSWERYHLQMEANKRANVPKFLQIMPGRGRLEVQAQLASGSETEKGARGHQKVP